MQPTFSLTSPRTSGAIAVLCATVIMAGCSKKQEAPHAQQAPQVVVFTVNPAALPMSAELPGRTNAYQVADVRPQVGGLIQKRLFVEGSDVKAGTALYQIDPATYQAAYNSAKAALSKAKANLLTAGPKASRYKELVAIEGVSRQEYDDAVAAFEQAKADVESATAALETANINLKYSTVTAPISGRTSRSAVTAGALVTAGQAQALTTVQQLDPIYVDVTQSSTDLLRLKRQMADGSLKKVGEGQAKVDLILPDGSKYSEPGKLQFAGVTVDPTTGNVVLRALFPNPKGELLPGMYVRAQLATGVDEKAITVPQVGVTRNQKGQATAMILNKENKVEQRILTTSGTIGNDWLVTSGLAAGDRVIVEGLQKIKPGAPAVAVPAKAEAAPAAAASAAASAASAH
ncbi:efflux RND transporter periplasmic adaptor subunit [Janthinobacterium sp. BJB1]|uniref:efflux RND transporter periplasmic adaptor subunit n=1 Tax=Janthinobacterium sp. GW458P TaxID=1981504 RepID=UPI000A3276E6|nr:efflux RND transporter periplasmic adaptor subunit [Janthinobacterium sp. GW458P]PHV16306.1 efflux RND transporter periplasmic adaptor subunit [Janthinobacterium sp. BJB303]PJC95960.1 efflux RND transporter periplasmic adaptor subunit [Janthinobacterium sp. BJB1]